MKAILFYGKVVSLLLGLAASGFVGYFLGYHDQAETNRKAHVANYRIGVYTGLKEAYRRQQAGEAPLNPVQPPASQLADETPLPAATAFSNLNIATK